MSQKAAVLGGGAFASKSVKSNSARYAATWPNPSEPYQAHSLFQYSGENSSLVR